MHSTTVKKITWRISVINLSALNARDLCQYQFAENTNVGMPLYDG